jgi:hypothetical protein
VHPPTPPPVPLVSLPAPCKINSVPCRAEWADTEQQNYHFASMERALQTVPPVRLQQPTSHKSDHESTYPEGLRNSTQNSPAYTASLLRFEQSNSRVWDAGVQVLPDAIRAVGPEARARTHASECRAGESFGNATKSRKEELRTPFCIHTKLKKRKALRYLC